MLAPLLAPSRWPLPPAVSSVPRPLSPVNGGLGDEGPTTRTLLELLSTPRYCATVRTLRITPASWAALGYTSKHRRQVLATLLRASSRLHTLKATNLPIRSLDFLLAVVATAADDDDSAGDTSAASPPSPPRRVAVLPSLHTVDFSQCTQLVDITALGVVAPHVQVVYFEGCRRLPSLNGLQYCSRLETARFAHCHALVDITAVAALRSLRSLSLAHCPGVDSLLPLWSLAALEALDVSGLQWLTTLRGLEHCCRLRVLVALGCVALRCVAALGACHRLHTATLRFCPELHVVGVLRTLQARHCLRTLDLTYGPER